MTKKKTLWIRHYYMDGSGPSVCGIARTDYSIRKVLTSPVGYYGRMVERYEVSVSPKRKSWYSDFNTYAEAKRFAGRLLSK